jgi:hypothetical protein
MWKTEIQRDRPAAVVPEDALNHGLRCLIGVRKDWKRLILYFFHFGNAVFFFLHYQYDTGTNLQRKNIYRYRIIT